MKQCFEEHTQASGMKTENESEATHTDTHTVREIHLDLVLAVLLLHSFIFIQNRKTSDGRHLFDVTLTLLGRTCSREGG